MYPPPSPDPNEPTFPRSEGNEQPSYGTPPSGDQPPYGTPPSMTPADQPAYTTLPEQPVYGTPPGYPPVQPYAYPPSQPYGAPAYNPSQPYGTPPGYPPAQPYGAQPGYPPPSQPYGQPPGYPPSQPYGAPPGYPPPSQPYGAPQGYGMPYGMPMMVPAPTNGLAVTSMVLGIASIVFFCGWYLSLPLGITGIILGAIGLNQINKGNFSGSSRGMAIAGLVTAGIGIVIAILFGILTFALFSNVSTFTTTN
jgi:hypothetical protein